MLENPGSLSLQPVFLTAEHPLPDSRPTQFLPPADDADLSSLDLPRKAT